MVTIGIVNEKGILRSPEKRVYIKIVFDPQLV